MGEGDNAGHEDVRSDGEEPAGPRWVLPAAMLLVGALLGAGVTWAVSAGDDDAEPVAADVLGTSTVPVGTESETDQAAVPDDADEAGGHGAVDPDRPTIVEFGGDDRAELAAQLLEVRDVALRYPTYADALAAGYVPTTPYAPGLGAHLGKPEDAQPPDEPLDLQRPQSYLYDGTDPDSRVVAVMYVKIGNEEMPEGFAGPLDIWNGVDGTFLDTIAWTQHVWVVPGWEAPGGVFAHSNPDLVCADGTTDSDPVEGCEAPSSTGGTT